MNNEYENIGNDVDEMQPAPHFTSTVTLAATVDDDEPDFSVLYELRDHAVILNENNEIVFCEPTVFHPSEKRIAEEKKLAESQKPHKNGKELRLNKAKDKTALLLEQSSQIVDKTASTIYKYNKIGVASSLFLTCMGVSPIGLPLAALSLGLGLANYMVKSKNMKRIQEAKNALKQCVSKEEAKKIEEEALAEEAAEQPVENQSDPKESKEDKKKEDKKKEGKTDPIVTLKAMQKHIIRWENTLLITGSILRALGGEAIPFFGVVVEANNTREELLHKHKHKIKTSESFQGAISQLKYGMDYNRHHKKNDNETISP